MKFSLNVRVWSVAMALSLFCVAVNAQDAPEPNGSTDQGGEAKDTPQPPTTKSPYRQLAPGVMKSVDPAQQLRENSSRHDVIELLAVDPNLDFAKDVPFRHPVWNLEFKFKPMRMIWVDVPQPSGYMQRKLIWYMVYSVTNTGKVMVPVKQAELPYNTHKEETLYEVQAEERPIRFAPEFLLEGHQRMQTDTGFTKVYPDRVIPVALGPITLREDPKRKFLNSVEMSREIEVGETVWGVATWEDIDPRIVRFSVYVQGLTNAYRWKDEPGEYQQGDEIGTGRKLYRKILKLNFWRPSDQYFEHEEEIRYGIPGGVDYQWVYR